MLKHPGTAELYFISLQLSVACYIQTIGCILTKANEQFLIPCANLLLLSDSFADTKTVWSISVILWILETRYVFWELLSKAGLGFCMSILSLMILCSSGGLSIRVWVPVLTCLCTWDLMRGRIFVWFISWNLCHYPFKE